MIDETTITIRITHTDDPEKAEMLNFDVVKDSTMSTKTLTWCLMKVAHTLLTIPPKWGFTTRLDDDTVLTITPKEGTPQDKTSMSVPASVWRTND